MIVFFKLKNHVISLLIYRGTSSCTKGKRLVLSMEGFLGLTRKITEIMIQHQPLSSLLSSSFPTDGLAMDLQTPGR